MLPEPTEKHQPWPGNRDLFRPVAGNRAGLCACPSLPLEKPTFPSRETPNGHTYTAPLCVPSPEPGGPTSRALCSEAPGSPHGPPHPAPSTRTPESDPGPGPRARSSKPKRVELPGLQGWLGGNARSWKGPAAKGGSCGDRGQEPPSPGDIPRAALLQVAQTDIVLLSLSPQKAQPRPQLQALDKTPSPANSFRRQKSSEARDYAAPPYLGHCCESRTPGE